MGEIRASVTLENRDDRGAGYLGLQKPDAGAAAPIRKGQTWPSAKPTPPTKGTKLGQVGSSIPDESEVIPFLTVALVKCPAVTTNPRQQPGQARGRGLRLDGIGSPGLAPPVVQTAAMATSSTATRVLRRRRGSRPRYDPATAAGTASTSRRSRRRGRRNSSARVSSLMRRPGGAAVPGSRGAGRPCRRRSRRLAGGRPCDAGRCGYRRCRRRGRPLRSRSHWRGRSLRCRFGR